MSTPVHLQFENVAVVFRGRVRAVDQLSFRIRDADRRVLIGPSGAGKSTVARLCAGLLRPDEGRVLVDGRGWHERSAKARRALRADVQILFQDSWGALDPRLRARSIIEAPLRIHGRWRSDKTAALAERVELPLRLLDRTPRELSGGERQRVALARALALEPRFLVLDEPMTGLDALVAHHLRRRILDLQEKLRMGILWITHDMVEAERIAQQVMVMDGGRIVERGSVQQVMSRPEHPTTRALLAARKVTVPPSAG